MASMSSRSLSSPSPSHGELRRSLDAVSQVVEAGSIDEAIDLLRQNVFFEAYPEASILDYIRHSNAEA
jgi:hypothetical protein